MPDAYNGEEQCDELSNIAQELATKLRARQKERREKALGLKFKGKARHSFWLSAKEEAEMVEREFGKHSWRSKLTQLIQSRKVQVGLLLLLLVDVIVVLTDLFLDAEFPPCSIILRNAHSCAAFGGSGGSSGSSGSHSGSGSGSGHSLCEEGTYETGAPAACDEHQHDIVTVAHKVLLWLSVSILSVFMLELLALTAALGAKFFRNRLYVLDFLVVSISLTLEVVVGAVLGPGDFTIAPGIIILVRIWRFVRILHGTSITVYEVGHDEHGDEEVACSAESLQQRIEELKAELRFQVASRAAQQKAIEELQLKAPQGAEEPEQYHVEVAGEADAGVEGPRAPHRCHRC
mmetsp:Transcript_6223/g.12408  ORF Transcript_6223/g.12408 Transcript_6223/m.12408 type:complete len:347 (+) Transcript_6223:62-1102(+)